MELESFPFDAQAFDIRIQLGKDKVSGKNLSLKNGYKAVQNINFPNMMAPQISDEYEFRPLRYSLSVTSHLETSEPRCEYMVSIPASRMTGYYRSNHYFFVFLMFLFSFTFFVLPVLDIANRIMNNMVLARCCACFSTLSMQLLLRAAPFALHDCAMCNPCDSSCRLFFLSTLHSNSPFRKRFQRLAIRRRLTSTSCFRLSISSSTLSCGASCLSG